MLSYHFLLWITFNILLFIITLHKVTLVKICVLIINELCDFQKK
jgi:hypothetical protein